jgi:hypothetical protein
MIAQEKYVPILKCKKGEFIALNKLPDNLKDEIIPIADLVPVQNKKSFVEHIKSSVGYIRTWGAERLLYIDGYMLQDTDLAIGRKKYMEYIFDELRRSKNNVIPVVSNISNLEYLNQVKYIIEKDEKGVCVRIFCDREMNINDEIESTIQRLNLNINQIDLLIDLQSVEILKVDEILNWQKVTFSNLVYPSSWRSLVLSGSNFPINLSKLTANQIHPIPRKHWLAWKRLFRNKDIERLPSYSDYGISHPLMSAFEGIPNASASIRYTHENEYYIYRGRGTRQHGFEQFFDLSESLINSEEFYGDEHCAGDKYISVCGTDKKKPGSLTIWRWVGSCHHLTVAVNQLRQFWRDFNAERTS